MRKSFCSLVLVFMVLPVAFSFAETDDVQLQDTLSVYSGYAVYRGYSSSDLVIVAVGYETFLGSPYLSTTVDLEVWIANQSLYYTSINLNLHPLGKSGFDPYLGVGLLNGGVQGARFIDLPITVGLNIWLGSSFGVRTQGRFFALTGTEFWEINFGLNFKM